MANTEKYAWLLAWRAGLVILALSAVLGYFASRSFYAFQDQAQLLGAIPRAIQLEDVGLGVGACGDVGIVNKGRLDIAIDRVVTSCGCTVASVSDVLLGPGSCARLSYKIKESYEEGDIDSKIIIKWHLAEQPQQNHILIVPVHGRYSSEMEVVPRIVFHDMPSGAFKDEIQVKFNGLKDKQTAGDLMVQLDGGELSVTSRKINNETFQVTVGGRMEDFPSGMSRRELQITYAGKASKIYQRGIPIILRRL